MVDELVVGRGILLSNLGRGLGAKGSGSGFCSGLSFALAFDELSGTGLSAFFAREGKRRCRGFFIVPLFYTEPVNYSASAVLNIVG